MSTIHAFIKRKLLDIQHIYCLDVIGLMVLREWDESKLAVARNEAAAPGAVQRINGVMNLVLNRELNKADRGMTVLGTIGSTSLSLNT